MRQQGERRTRLLIGATAGVVGLVVGVVLAGVGDHGDTSDPTPSDPTPAPTVALAPPDPTDPASSETDLATPTRDGAVLAAVEWMQRFTPALYLDDDRRRAAVSEIAAADAEAELQQITADIAEQFRTAGLTLAAAQRGVRVALPAGYRLVEFSETAAVVELWVGAVVHLEEIAPLSASWDRQTTTMRWEDGAWRLVSIDTTDGPTPDFTVQGDGELPATLDVIESFTEFTHAP